MKDSNTAHELDLTDLPASPSQPSLDDSVVALAIAPFGWSAALQLVDVLGWPCPMRDPQPGRSLFPVHLTDPETLSLLHAAGFVELGPGVAVVTLARLEQDGVSGLADWFKCEHTSTRPRLDDRCHTHWFFPRNWERFTKTRLVGATTAVPA